MARTSIFKPLTMDDELSIAEPIELIDLTLDDEEPKLDIDKLIYNDLFSTLKPFEKEFLEVALVFICISMQARQFHLIQSNGKEPELPQEVLKDAALQWKQMAKSRADLKKIQNFLQWKINDYRARYPITANLLKGQPAYFYRQIIANHFFFLTLCYSTPDTCAFQRRPEEIKTENDPYMVIEDLPEVYHVEAIEDKRMFEDKPYYYVKWLGYDEHTWEPAENLDCPDLLFNFWFNYVKPWTV